MDKPPQFSLDYLFVELFLVALTLGIGRVAFLLKDSSGEVRSLCLLVAAIPAAAAIGGLFGAEAMWKTALVVFFLGLAIVAISAACVAFSVW